MELSPSAAVLVLVAAAAVVVVVGPRMVGLADRLADATGLGEAFVGAVMLGAATSLPDIVATAQPAWSGFGEQAASNALGGILAQTAFLAVADLAYPRANLEHAAASLSNVVQASVLVALLALIAVALAAPGLTVGPVHAVTLVLPPMYWYGQRLVYGVEREPLWEPVETAESRPDEPDPRNVSRSVPRLAAAAAALGVVLATAGWFVGEAGQSVVATTGLTQGAVGALLTATSTSMAELVVSVSAVRRGALVLAVSSVLGGNSFDALLMIVADVTYRDGTVYATVGASTDTLAAIAIVMTMVLVLGMLRRERHGIANIGTESAGVLVLYGVAVALLL